MATAPKRAKELAPTAPKRSGDAPPDLLPASKRTRPALPSLLAWDAALSLPSQGQRDLEETYRAAAFLLNSSSISPALLFKFAMQATLLPLSTPAIDSFLRRLPRQAVVVPRDNESEEALMLAQSLYYLVKLASSPEAVRRDWGDAIALCKQSKVGSLIHWFASRALAAAYGLDDFSTASLAARSAVGPDPWSPQSLLPSGSIADLTKTSSTEEAEFPALDFTVDVFGALVTPGPLPRKPLDLAPTPSLQKSLRLIALASEYASCVVVKGPSGSGKTTMVKALTGMCGRVLVEIQMDEHSDAQSMLGSVTCTDTPGVFAWSPGAITVAATRGQWVLMEDADRLPAEVLASLMHALDLGQLYIKQQFVPLAPGFRIFFTTAASAIPVALKGRCPVVAIGPLSPEDVHAVALQLFPKLPSGLTQSIVNAAQAGSMATRDTLRWLRRVDAFGGIASDRVFITEREKEAAVMLGGEVVPVESAVALAGREVPRLCELPALRGDLLQVGRVTFPPMIRDEDAAPVPSFAWTSVALFSLHAMSAAVALNEAVLLVGETGTGKTAIVQLLAAMAGKKLLVINMHVSSDSAELVGAFKPVDLAREARVLQSDFAALFARHFSVGDNSAFLQTVVDAIEARKWTKLVRAWRKACAEGHRKSALQDWLAFSSRAEEFSKRCEAPAFSFEEGSLVKALRAGHWVLLDEVNLASAETLDRLSPLLDGPTGSLCLSDRGDVEPIPRHPDFRLFACMNPPNDVGKKALPAAMEARMARVEVPEIVSDADLGLVVARYLDDARDKTGAVVGLFKKAREMAETRVIVDGAGQRPRYSLRTLVRALESARRLVSVQGMGIQRALREGFEATCLTWLNRTSFALLKAEMDQFLPPPPSAPPPKVKEGSSSNVVVGGFVLASGDGCGSVKAEQFIVTPSVAENVKAVARAVVLSKYPVLLQGPTSAGKTSLVHYLADSTGHRFVRINNHEHTDLQEYVGGYSSDPTSGSLVFKEGVLVTALRQGHWLVLDELNLAPTEVLEALNRLLDDNRELFIPETGETVKPHSHFMLFATQNPPGGAYGGRKQLSRALRNRFLEVHVEDIPPSELETVLMARSQLPRQFCLAMINVMIDLQLVRSSSSLFAGKAGLITPRDLLKWCDRKPTSYSELALTGFSLLAERRRAESDRQQIRGVLEKHLRCAVPSLDETVPQSVNMVWTQSMRRLYALLSLSCDHAESVLLVGETGCGKTSAVMALAQQRGKRLVIVNLHANTEASDLLGSLRPAHNALFQWVDGPLITCMRHGDFLLLDELSLADDAVLERLNSVLDRSRTMLLPERDGETVVAHPDFRLFATMNPGGDFGKRELSPALRNRFTEVWIPPVDSEQDFRLLCRSMTPSGEVAQVMVAFTMWFNARSPSPPLNTRDLVAWSDFINNSGLAPHLGLAHGCHLVVLDGLPLHMSVGKATAIVSEALAEFPQLAVAEIPNVFQVSHGRFGCAPFSIPIGPNGAKETGFSLDAPTSARNMQRVLRAMQLGKAVLLEGSPGVGKTGLVEALAKSAGFALERVNLSEHTDFADLIGSDFPTPQGTFEWRDGPLLASMKRGSWVLLDELNLAGQTVLEGLNSLLDHRGVVYVPELDQQVVCAPGFRLFAAQNPPDQGGGRKGLPRSFLSRFSKVFVAPLGRRDIHSIVRKGFPALNENLVSKVLDDNEAANAAVGGEGWNLRDIIRRCELAAHGVSESEAVDLVYFARLLRPEDRTKLLRVIPWVLSVPAISVNDSVVAIGSVTLERKHGLENLGARSPVLVSRLCRPLQQVARCVQMRWPALVWGGPCSGKSTLVRTLADVVGARLIELMLSPSTDLHDLLGGFAQVEEQQSGAIPSAWTTSKSSEQRASVDDTLSRDGKAWVERERTRVAAILGAKPTPRFEWVDGPLVRAMELGHWIVLDNANACPPSVLDRLNPLLEPNGRLSFGSRVVTAHSDFRIFVLCNPSGGSLSRALINRCCQVSLSPTASPHDDAAIARDALWSQDWTQAGQVAAHHRGNWKQLRCFVHLAERGMGWADAHAVAYDGVPASSSALAIESGLPGSKQQAPNTDVKKLEPESVFGTRMCLFRRDWKRDAFVSSRRLPLITCASASELARARAAWPLDCVAAPQDLLSACGVSRLERYCPAEVYLGLVRNGLVPGEDWEAFTQRVLQACQGPAGMCARGEGESLLHLYCLPVFRLLAWLPEADDWLRALMLQENDLQIQLRWARLLRAAVASQHAHVLEHDSVAQIDSGLPTPCLASILQRPELKIDPQAPRPPINAELWALRVRLDALADPSSAAGRRDVVHAMATWRWANEDASRVAQARAAVEVAEAVCAQQQLPSSPPSKDGGLMFAVYARWEAKCLLEMLRGRLPEIKPLQGLYESSGCVPAIRLGPFVELAWSADTSRIPRLLVEICFFRLAYLAPSVAEACERLLEETVRIEDVAARESILRKALEALRGCPEDVSSSLDALLFEQWASWPASAAHADVALLVERAKELHARGETTAWTALGYALAVETGKAVTPLDPRAEAAAGHQSLLERMHLVEDAQRAWSLHRLLEFGEEAARLDALQEEGALLALKAKALEPSLVAPRSSQYRRLVQTVKGMLETLLADGDAIILATSADLVETLRSAALSVAEDIVCDFALPFAHALLLMAKGLDASKPAKKNGSSSLEDDENDVVDRMRRLHVLDRDGAEAADSMRAAVHAWRVRKDEQDRKAAEAASQVVWESKAPAEEEKNEQTFRALFPEYHAEFDGEGAAAAAAASEARVPGDGVAPAFVRLFVRGADSSGAEGAEDEWAAFARVRRNELAAQLAAVAKALHVLKGVVGG